MMGQAMRTTLSHVRGQDYVRQKTGYGPTGQAPTFRSRIADMVITRTHHEVVWGRRIEAI